MESSSSDNCKLYVDVAQRVSEELSVMRSAGFWLCTIEHLLKSEHLVDLTDMYEF